jgi:hypothetical protein
MFTESNVIALFNARLFPEKSFPKVDQAFRFFPSRYQEFFYENAQIDDSEPVVARQGGREPMLAFLRQHFPERLALLEQARQGILGGNADLRAAPRGLMHERIFERLFGADAAGLDAGAPGSSVDGDDFEDFPADEAFPEPEREIEQVREVEQPRPIFDGPFGEIGFAAFRPGRSLQAAGGAREASVRDVALARMAAAQQNLEELRVVFGVPDGVDFTPEDFQALTRLYTSGMGVDRRTIVAVYQACDRNEAIAQNCLISMH